MACSFLESSFLYAIRHCIHTNPKRLLDLRAMGLLLFCVAASICHGQVPQSDPQAVALAAKAITALTNGTAVTDVTLTGTVTWQLGSDTDSGTATLMALGSGESRMDLSLGAGTRSEIRDASTGMQQGKWVAPTGISGPYAFQNCWTDASWFFPALGSLAAGPNVVLLYVGSESLNGVQVQHLQSYIYQANQVLAVGPLQWSSMDFYLDAASFLPRSISYSAHPDDDMAANIPMEVRFDSYQLTSGVNVPFHIQRFFNGNPVIDITLTNVAINTGLAVSQFSIQ